MNTSHNFSTSYAEWFKCREWIDKPVPYQRYWVIVGLIIVALAAAFFTGLKYMK